MLQSRAKARSLIRSERGTALVEFAIMAPVFLFLLVGLIEVSRYAYFALLAANGVRAGAAYGAQNTITADDTAGMAAAAAADAPNLPSGVNGVNFSAAHICLLSGTATPCSGTTPQSNWVYFVVVTATGHEKTLLNYPGIPQNIPISASATMRVSSQ